MIRITNTYKTNEGAWPYEIHGHVVFYTSGIFVAESWTDMYQQPTQPQTHVRKGVKTHRVDVLVVSRDNIVESFVNGVRWHDQVGSDVLQKAKASYENAFLGYDDRSAAGGACSVPKGYSVP